MITLDKAMKGDVFNQIKQLVQFGDKLKQRQPKKPNPNYNSLWFPTPETCDNPEQLTAIPRKIYEEICNFQLLDKEDPKNNEGGKKEFFSKV